MSLDRIACMIRLRSACENLSTVLPALEGAFYLIAESRPRGRFLVQYRLLKIGMAGAFDLLENEFLIGRVLGIRGIAVRHENDVGRLAFHVRGPHEFKPFADVFVNYVLD